MSRGASMTILSDVSSKETASAGTYLHTYACMHIEERHIDAGPVPQKASWIVETSCIPFGRLTGPKARFAHGTHTVTLWSPTVFCLMYSRGNRLIRAIADATSRFQDRAYRNGQTTVLPQPLNASASAAAIRCTYEINRGADKNR